jgi:GNAT superfamily N-acetyltransferase
LKNDMTPPEDSHCPFSDLELARRLERAEAHASAKFVEARARAFPKSGAQWIEVAGAYAMYDGPASPVTQTFGLGIFQEPNGADLDRIESFFRERGAPVFHEVSPLAGLRLAMSLSDRGYQPAEFTSVMYCPIQLHAKLAAPANERIQVRPIARDEGALWAQTVARGWSDLPELTEYLQELGPIAACREDSVSFLAFLHDQPIAGAALCLHNGVALLAGACTIPEARRQGAQRALLESRLRFAAQQGCNIAMMCAAPGSASQRNAEREGFRIAYTRLKWRLRST